MRHLKCVTLKLLRCERHLMRTTLSNKCCANICVTCTTFSGGTISSFKVVHTITFLFFYNSVTEHPRERIFVLYYCTHKQDNHALVRAHAHTHTHMHAQIHPHTSFFYSVITLQCSLHCLKSNDHCSVVFCYERGKSNTNLK